MEKDKQAQADVEQKTDNASSKPNEISFSLSDGRKAVLRLGTGKDLLIAQRTARSTDEVIWALIAQLLKIEGKSVIMEELYELNLTDSVNIFGRLDDVFLLPAEISSTSPTLPDGVALS